MNTPDSTYIKKKFGAKVLAILKRLAPVSLLEEYNNGQGTLKYRSYDGQERYIASSTDPEGGGGGGGSVLFIEAHFSQDRNSVEVEISSSEVITALKNGIQVIYWLSKPSEKDANFVQSAIVSSDYQFETNNGVDVTLLTARFIGLQGKGHLLHSGNDVSITD